MKTTERHSMTFWCVRLQLPQGNMTGGVSISIHTNRDMRFIFPHHKKWAWITYCNSTAVQVSNLPFFYILKSIIDHKVLALIFTFYSYHLLFLHSLKKETQKKKNMQLDQNCSELTAFFHFGLQLWIPGQCLLLMLITVGDFPDGILKVFPTPAAWKTQQNPISNSKWKDKWQNVPAGSAWFPAENVWLLFVCVDRRCCCGTEGVWVLQGNSYKTGTPEGKHIVEGGAGCVEPLV